MYEYLSPDFLKVLKASCGLSAIGSPCRLNEVFNTAPTPEIFSNNRKFFGILKFCF